jgi:hypothetical protein
MHSAAILIGGSGARFQGVDKNALVGFHAAPSAARFSRRIVNADIIPL